MDNLAEGNYYDFSILRLAVLPDNEEYIILSDFSGHKHLLRKNDFQGYQLLPGNSVRCRVDKINCSGQVFLEPENPYYQVGETYQFKVCGKSEIVNSFGDYEKFLIVQGLDNRTILVSTFLPDNSIPEYLECKVEKIKKGRIYLVSFQTGFHPYLVTGKNYDFIVTGMVTLAGDTEYFLLTDPFGKYHLAREKYFRYYGLTKGCTVKGFIIDDTDHYLELENPFYEIGKTYSFRIAGVEEVVNDNGSNGFSLMVFDRNGVKCPVIPLYRNFLNLKPGGVITGKVGNIRKGRLYICETE